MPNKRSPRAVIAGGSLAGLFTALLLRQRGWDVQVYERVATPPYGRGAGIVTHRQLWHILDQLGLNTRAGFGVQVHSRITLASDGCIIGSRVWPQTMTSWDQLFSMLRGIWPDDRYSLAAEIIQVTDTPGPMIAHLRNGTTIEADLVVGADGIRSSLRALVAGEVAPHYAGYVAWRGLLAEAAIPRDAYAVLAETFAFCLPDGEQMLGYPVAGEQNDLRPGHRRYNFVWYRPADANHSLPGLLTDETGHVHAGSIPPPLIRRSVMAAMREAAETVLAPQFAAVVRATQQPFLQPVYDLETPRMVRGRLALVGDSAFVARPHVGAGVTKAAEDALALAEALQAEPDVSQALLRYEAERMSAGRRVVARARQLGAYMQAQSLTEAERLAAERHRTPEAVMTETASLAF